MIYFIPVSGLCNRMRALDSVVSLCGETGNPLRVYWVKDPIMNCAFADLFQPIPGIELVEKNAPFVFTESSKMSLYSPRVYSKFSDWEILNKYDVRFMQESGFDFRQLNRSKILMAANIRFYPSEKMFDIFVPLECLRQRIAQESASFDKNTIGIHIRRTDNRKSIAYSPTELFEQAIEQEIESNPEVNFYLACDCAAAKRQLHNKYGDRIITNFDEGDRTTKEGMQQALVELYALSRTRKIYGSYWSSFSHTAAHIGGIEEITVKTDE